MMAWEITAYVASAILTCVATLGAVFISHRLKAKQCDTVKAETKHNENVYTALNYTLEEMGADRAYVLEFHNGIHYFSGRGQQKFSCSYEIVQEGISAECHNSQDHRVSNYHTYVSELIEKEKFEYTDINAIVDHVFAGLLRHKGVKSIYNVPIQTLNGKIIGILGVDYVKGPAIKEIIDQELEKDKKVSVPIEAKLAPSKKGISISKFDDSTYVFMKRQARIIAGYLL